MTPWAWWWLAEGDDEHGGWAGCHDSRDEAVADAQRHLPAGTRFRVMEARSSDAMKYEGADCVPFLRTRNEEWLTAGECADG
jgi:hypothetical protein